MYLLLGWMERVTNTMITKSKDVLQKGGKERKWGDRDNGRDSDSLPEARTRDKKDKKEWAALFLCPLCLLLV